MDEAGKIRKGSDYLLISFPCANARGYENRAIYPMHQPKDWSRPGAVNGWKDGRINWKRPTLNKSIKILNPDKSVLWHGYVRAGELVDA